MSTLEERIIRERELYEQEKAKFSGKLENRMKKIRTLEDTERQRKKKLQTRCDIILGAIVRKNADALLTRDMRSILDEFVTRDHERPLFGLPPLKPEPDPVEKTEGTVTIWKVKDQVRAQTPAPSDTFRAGIRDLGGEWSRAGKYWHAPAAFAGDVRDLAQRCYEKVETPGEG